MKQTLLSIILVVALIGAGYFTYQLFAGPSGQVSSSSRSDQQLEEYKKIETLKPDLSIFTDSFFRSLFSPSQTFGAVPVSPASIHSGRPNPFQPF